MNPIKNRLKRAVGLADAYSLIVGNVIGIGIFTTSGYVAGYVHSAGWMLLVWLLGGLLAVCGGLSYAELASRFPRAGGDFHYLTNAYHPLLGFIFGWSAFSVTYTGSIAVIAMGLSHYALNLFPNNYREMGWTLPLIGTQIGFLKLFAVAAVAVMTGINARGIRAGARWQTIFTMLGIGVLLGFTGLGLSSETGVWPSGQLFHNSGGVEIFSQIGTALAAVFFTYAGWTAIVYVAGEVCHPVRTIPRALWSGILTVTLLYLMINIVYLYALPMPRMAGIVDIGYQALLVLRGQGWSLFFTLMIMTAVLSTLNATVMSGSRIYYAMAREKRFFSIAGQIHPRHGSPAAALWLQFAWSSVLILSGSFNMLLAYTVFVMVLFALLAGISLFVLRRRAGLPPYAAWGYPFTPLLFILFTGWILVNTFLAHPLQSLLGILLVATGLPFYVYFKKKRG